MVRSIVRLRCGLGRYETVRRTRVTVGYLRRWRAYQNLLRFFLLHRAPLQGMEGLQGEGRGDCDVPSVVDFAGLELDLDDLAALRTDTTSAAPTMRPRAHDGA